MGVLSDVGISHIVNAGHIFVQQPAHPSFNSWQAFNDIMNKCYTDGSQVPPLPPNVEGIHNWFINQITLIKKLYSLGAS